MNQDIQAVKVKAADQDIKVVKRDGTKESIDLEKIHRVVHWASQDLENISAHRYLWWKFVDRGTDGSAITKALMKNS